MTDAGDEHGGPGVPEDGTAGPDWPLKGPATAQQAILAIGFVFFLGVAVGFLLARTF